METDPCTVVVVTGGDAVDPAVRDRLPAGARVIAADSGLHHAAALGLRVDLVVGDLDSATPEAVAAASAAGASVERHPRAKDKIDLELALDAARDRGARRVVVVGGHGGRVDMFLANALLLSSPAYAGIVVEAHVGRARLYVGRGEVIVDGRPGEVVTLLPVHGPVWGVRTRGLRYPLRDEALPAGTSRGASNVLTATTARITSTDGTLLCILPGTSEASDPEASDPDPSHPDPSHPDQDAGRPGADEGAP